MKGKLFKRSMAFVTAMIMALGVASVLPVENLPLLGIVASAEDGLSDSLSIGESTNVPLVAAVGETSGQCGDNVFWELSSDGTLSFTGTGTMGSWTYSKERPWYPYIMDIKNIVINYGITDIAPYAFKDCENIEHVSLPTSLVEIGSGAFYGCNYLEDINIPDSVLKIGSEAFAYCSLVNVKLPNSLNKIPSGLFTWCDFEKIIIPDSVTSIGNSAFAYCRSLKEINLPEGLESVGASAFFYTDIENIVLPNKISSIEDSTFAYSSIKSIYIPETVSFIGHNVFEWCTSLNNITIPSNVSFIGFSCFEYCKSLTELVIPENINTICADAFKNCTNLNKVTIYNKNTSFGTSSSLNETFSPFEGCDNLVLHGYNGSTSETHAKEYNIPFVALTTDFSSATITEHTDSFNIGDDVLFNVVIRDSDGNPINVSDLSSELSFTTTVSNTNCIRIDSEATDLTGAFIKATAIGEGTATVTITFSNGVTAPSTVTVNNDYDFLDPDKYLSFACTSGKTEFTYDTLNEKFIPDSSMLNCSLFCSYIPPLGSESEYFFSITKIEITAPQGFSFSETGSLNYLERFGPANIYTIENGDKHNSYDFQVPLYPISYSEKGEFNLTIKVYGDNNFLKTFNQKITVNNYKTPVDINSNYDTTDTDGDGLPDIWETQGLFFDGEFLDLPAMGSDPKVPDVFVEIDYQEDYDLSILNQYFEMMYNQFKKHNINLHIDAGINSIDYVTGREWGRNSRSNPIPGTVQINQIDTNPLDNTPILKWKELIDNNFNENPIRTLVFRHCIFGEEIKNPNIFDKATTFGYSAGTPSQYFFIAYGSFLKYSNFQSLRSYDVIVAFMHELGHNLGLHHGGIDKNGNPDDTNNKPDYLSVMNYNYSHGGATDVNEDKYTENAMNYSNYNPNDWERLMFKANQIGSNGAALKLYLNNFYETDFEIVDEEPIIIPNEHTHSFSSSWNSNTTYHWHECNCGDKTDMASHVSNNGVVTVQPTATSTGVRTYSCSVCGYVMSTETIPATGNNYNPVYPYYPTPSYPDITPNITPSIVVPSVSTPALKVKAKIKGDTVTLTWNKIKGAESYTVYQYKKGKYVKLKETDKTAVTYKKLKNGKTYKFLVKYTKNGRLSSTANSGKVSVTIKYKPVVKATSTQNSVTLKWSAVDGAEKYAVYKYVNGKAKKLTETTKTAVKITKLTPNKEYSYIIRAYIDGKWTTMTKSDIVTIETK